MKKQILTGAESFEEIIEGSYFYIDKTLFIKELLENRGKVTLITRPRRFGKTMNMSMLRSFFDIGTPPSDDSAGKCSRALFDGLGIMGHEDIIEKHMNKYPVVFLTLKNVEQPTYEESISTIRSLISAVCRQNRYLLDSDRLDGWQKKVFLSLFMGESTLAELRSSLFFLTECLHSYHNKRAIVLLDEYDAPLTNAYIEGYYSDMIKFMRGFLGSAFKGNDYLEFGVLTGVQRISRESMFSSFNNPKVCGVMDKAFATCFGFTENEVKEACLTYGVADMFDEVKQWYDGYRFGGRDMYNPWSITGFLEELEIGNYWVNTGGLSVMKDIFYKGDNNLRDDLAGLLTGSPVMMSLEEGITYPIEYVKSDTFWTLFLNAGYIKPCNGGKSERFGAELVNMEVRNMFSRYAKNWFREQQPSLSEEIVSFVSHLLRGDAGAVRAALNDDILNNPSSFDLQKENSYHMFIYGMLLAVSGDYTVYSNPESGKGRSDCMIKPFDKEIHAVVIEFKHIRGDGKDLKQEAQSGLEQIEKKAYMHSLKQEGYERIYKYGIAFYKKSCEVAFG